MINIVLLEPRIPQNTGNIGRLALATNARLHLIHPLGFVINDKALKRAGMDYFKSIDLIEWDSLEAFLKANKINSRHYFLSTKAGRCYFEADFRGVKLESSKNLPLEHSSLGNHFIDLLNFRELTDLSLVNPLKFSKNSKSTTANIRMLGESLDSKVDSTNLDSVESALDSSAESTLDSTQSVESNNINPHEVRPIKSVVGGGGESKNSDCGSELRFCSQLQSETQQNLSPLPLSQGIDRVEDYNIIGDSKNLAESTLDSTDCYLWFGREDAGLPSALLEANKANCFKIPMFNNARSLNLSNAVSIIVYEVLRQNLSQKR